MKIRFFGDGTVHATDELILEGTSLFLDSPIVRLTAASASSYVSASEFIGPLTGNASTATTASHAIYAETAGTATDVNALYTASVVDATISFLKGGGGTFPIEVNNVSSSISASYAVTASFALNAGTPNLEEVLNTGAIATSSFHRVDISGSIITGEQHGVINTTNTFAVVGGQSHQMGVINRAGIFAGWGHRFNTGDQSVMLGGGDNNMSAAFSGIVAGEGLSINGAYSFIAGGTTNTINAGYGAIVGAEGSQINSSYCGLYSAQGTQIHNADSSAGLGGYLNYIQGNRTFIVGGQSNRLETGTTNSGIIGGTNNNVNTNVTGSVIIGGSGIQATVSDTVHVPSLRYTGSLESGVTNTITGAHGAAIATQNAIIAANEDSIIG